MSLLQTPSTRASRNLLSMAAEGSETRIGNGSTDAEFGSPVYRWTAFGESLGATEATSRGAATEVQVGGEYRFSDGEKR